MILGELEDGRPHAVKRCSALFLRILYRTDHIVESADKLRQKCAQYDSGKATTNEALPRLLGAQLNERGATKEESEQIGAHIVDDNHTDRDNEPDEPFKEILYDEI